MNILDFPVRKEYIVKGKERVGFFPLFHYNYTISFKQATLYELRLYQLDTDKYEWTLDFIRNHSNIRKPADFLEKNTELMEKVIELYLNGNSKYKPLVFEYNNAKNNNMRTTTSSYYFDICNSLNIDIYTLLKEYTYEQMEFCAEGLVFSKNNESEQGKLINQKAIEKRLLNLN